MNLIRVENEIAILNEDVSKKIADFEKKLKEIKEQEDVIKQEILGEMEAKGIIKVETDDLLISYIASSDRETFDTKTFKAEHQEQYDEYIKMTPVKSSIRIKVK